MVSGFEMRVRAIVPVIAGMLFAAGIWIPGLTWMQNAAAQPSSEFQAIGKFLSITGTVTVEHAAGAAVFQASLPANASGQANVGDVVYRGDVIETGGDGIVGLVFTDGTSFNISSNARMELNEFIYDPKGKSNATLLNLKKGAFTFIAGAIAKTGDMKIETPVGTMGIRGTAPHVEIAEDGTVRFSTLVEENKKKSAKGAPAADSRRASNETARPPRSAVADLATCNGTDGKSAELRIAACTALIETQVENPQALAIAYNNRGSARSTKGDYELAIADYDSSIKLNPTLSNAFNNRGLAYKKKGASDQAIADFTKAISLSPDDAGPLANRGQAYENKRDYELALKDFNDAIRIQPALGSLWNERCLIRAIGGGVQDALADCNEAIRLGPASADKFDSRGFAYLKSGQWDLAVADFNSALRLRPRLASSTYGRGYAKLKSGDVAGGRADIAAASRARPSIVQEIAVYRLN